MKCEICRKGNVHAGMYVMLIDINGTNKLAVCQPCLKKLKVAYNDPSEKTMEFYPSKK